jgi:hypothetical protein
VVGLMEAGMRGAGMTRRSIARAAVAMGVTLGLGLGAAGSAAAQELVTGVIAPLTGSKAEPARPS